MGLAEARKRCIRYPVLPSHGTVTSVQFCDSLAKGIVHFYIFWIHSHGSQNLETLHFCRTNHYYPFLLEVPWQLGEALRLLREGDRIFGQPHSLSVVRYREQRDL